MGGATRFGSGDGSAHERAWDPDRWWTFGEAADRAGVAHRTLAAWAAEGKVQVRGAWREGAEIRLVRAGDVAALAPAARESAELRGDDLEQRAVFTGPRRSALGSSPVGAPVEPEAAGEEPPEESAWQREAEREIERLRGELDELREQRDRARDELSGSRTASESERATHGAAEVLIERPLDEQIGVPAGRRPARRAAAVASWVTVAVAAILALVLGGVLGRGTSAEAADDETEGRTEQATAAVTRVATDEPAPVVEPSSGAAVDTAADDTAADDDVDPTEVETAPSPDPAPASEVALVEPAIQRVPGLRISLPATYRTIVAGREAAFVDEPPCALSGLVATSLGARRALGPCFGPLTQDGRAVAGTNRFDGTPCCRHHAFVERLTGAATDEAARDRLVLEAEHAEKEGLVPPLLVQRAERSASRFLAAALGTWEASGLDGPREGMTHEWSLLPAVDVVELELVSWVAPGESKVARRFRVILELVGEDEGDVLRSFEWLDD